MRPTDNYAIDPMQTHLGFNTEQMMMKNGILLICIVIHLMYFNNAKRTQNLASFIIIISNA